MSHIFTSYSRRNSGVVDKVVQVLERAGIEVWLDREDIKAGNSWRVQIVTAIDECDAFVLALSADSAASVNVHKEVILAQDSGKAIFILMLEPVKIPAEIRYQLAGLQFIDLQTLGFDASIEQLTVALQSHLKKIRPASEETHKQVELVIQGVDISSFDQEKQQQLLAFISNLTNTNQSQLNIANVAAGSLHVFVDMPADAARQLKTLALNGDSRFKELSIVSFRMAGDIHYIHTANGTMLPDATRNSVATFFSSTIGKLLIGLIFVILIGMFALAGNDPPPASVSVTDTVSASTSTDRVPTETREISTPTATFTPEPTFTPTVTLTATPVPVVYQTLKGIISNERSSCRYGPGTYYLDNETLRLAIKIEVLGRDVNSSWGYAQADGYAEPCWVDFKNIELDGGIDSLEPVYPGKVSLPLSFIWSEPKNIYTVRTADGNTLNIYWDEYILPDGELESPQSPRFLLELWLCRNNELTFVPTFVWTNSASVVDEAGCSEASGGVIYLVEKHGYTGPVEIPWTPHP